MTSRRAVASSTTPSPASTTRGRGCDAAGRPPALTLRRGEDGRRRPLVRWAVGSSAPAAGAGTSACDRHPLLLAVRSSCGSRSARWHPRSTSEPRVVHRIVRAARRDPFSMAQLRADRCCGTTASPTTRPAAPHGPRLASLPAGACQQRRSSPIQGTSAQRISAGATPIAHSQRSNRPAGVPLPRSRGSDRHRSTRPDRGQDHGAAASRTGRGCERHTVPAATRRADRPAVVRGLASRAAVGSAARPPPLAPAPPPATPAARADSRSVRLRSGRRAQGRSPAPACSSQLSPPAQVAPAGAPGDGDPRARAAEWEGDEAVRHGAASGATA